MSNSEWEPTRNLTDSEIFCDRLIAHINHNISKRFPRHTNGFFLKIIVANIRGFFAYIEPEYTLQKKEINEEE
jgi:hypothetical protein